MKRGGKDRQTVSTSRAEFSLPPPRHEPRLCLLRRGTSLSRSPTPGSLSSRQNRQDSSILRPTSLAPIRLHQWPSLWPPPPTPSRGTVILVHGFSDLSFGWRYQIPPFYFPDLPCIAIDCLGDGRPDAPPMSTLNQYDFKRCVDDIAELCR